MSKLPRLGLRNVRFTSQRTSRPSRGGCPLTMDLQSRPLDDQPVGSFRTCHSGIVGWYCALKPLVKLSDPPLCPGAGIETQAKTFRWGPNQRLRVAVSVDGQIAENIMQSIQDGRAGDGHLRFVFRDAVVSFDLAADVTCGEIARRLRELSPRRHRNPVAIDITLATEALRGARQCTS